jgi:hypothetical protein
VCRICRLELDDRRANFSAVIASGSEAIQTRAVRA